MISKEYLERLVLENSPDYLLPEDPGPHLRGSFLGRGGTYILNLWIVASAAWPNPIHPSRFFEEDRDTMRQFYDFLKYNTDIIDYNKVNGDVNLKLFEKVKEERARLKLAYELEHEDMAPAVARTAIRSRL